MVKERLHRAPRLKARARVAGFTLVELLVSLVILGFVMALVSESVFQVAQVTRAADENTRRLVSKWGAGWTVNSLLANLLAPEMPVEDPVLTGSPTRIDGYTSQPLDGSEIGLTRFELQLKSATGAVDATDMLADLGQAAPSTGLPGSSSVVATFNGRAEFAYVGRDNEVVATWPPLTRIGLEPEDLPRAILVRDARSGNILMWYGFQGETTRQRRPTMPFAGAQP
jgi:prepilin-type N-terminal cleavage/methylation domain-containing protein